MGLYHKGSVRGQQATMSRFARRFRFKGVKPELAESRASSRSIPALRSQTANHLTEE